MTHSLLVYSSEIAQDSFRGDRPFGDQLREMLARARVNNGRIGVTGMLLYRAGQFIQVLEGHPMVLRRLFGKIALDPRHRNVRQLAFLAIEQRLFEKWHMGLLNLDEYRVLDPELLDQFKAQVQYSITDDEARQCVVTLLKQFSEHLDTPDKCRLVES